VAGLGYFGQPHVLDAFKQKLVTMPQLPTARRYRGALDGDLFWLQRLMSLGSVLVYLGERGIGDAEHWFIALIQALCTQVVAAFYSAAVLLAGDHRPTAELAVLGVIVLHWPRISYKALSVARRPE